MRQGRCRSAARGRRFRGTADRSRVRALAKIRKLLNVSIDWRLFWTLLAVVAVVAVVYVVGFWGATWLNELM